MTLGEAADLAQVITAATAIFAVVYAVRLGERTLGRHDEQLRKQEVQLREYVATEGGAYCTNFREHILRLHEKNMTPARIRELLACEVGMLASNEKRTEFFSPEEAAEALRSDPDRRLEAELNCGLIDEIVRLADWS